MSNEPIFDYTPILDIVYNIKQLPKYRDARLIYILNELAEFINRSKVLPDHIEFKHSDYKDGWEFRSRMLTLTSLGKDEKPLANIGFITEELEEYLSTNPDPESLIFPKSVFRKSISVPFEIFSRLPKTKASPQIENKTECGQLTLENENLRKEIEHLKKQVPILLGSYREDDPLMLAIEMRNKHWSDYNPDDKRSRPTQEAILEDLYQMGIDKTEAERIERVSSPIRRNK